MSIGLTLKVYQVDAFASRVYTGNPAAVVPLKEWLAEEVMQNIAAENNLAETAFFVKNEDQYDIRWFTPTDEVPLCGHATLASAHVLFNELDYQGTEIAFNCKSGSLTVSKNGELLKLNFPSNPVTLEKFRKEATLAFGCTPLNVYSSEKYYLLFEFETEKEIVEMIPDFQAMTSWNETAIVVTAKGKKHDFVSRMFAPKIGVNEDPVTGSAHTRLVPFWANKLGKNTLFAKQVSFRGGELHCELKGNRVEMSGTAVLYLKGEIYI